MQAVVIRNGKKVSSKTFDFQPSSIDIHPNLTEVAVGNQEVFFTFNAFFRFVVHCKICHHELSVLSRQQMCTSIVLILIQLVN